MVIVYWDKTRVSANGCGILVSIGKKEEEQETKVLICSSFSGEINIFCFSYKIDELRNICLRVLLKVFVSVRSSFTNNKREPKSQKL
jgi:hypothetical protein